MRSSRPAFYAALSLLVGCTLLPRPGPIDLDAASRTGRLQSVASWYSAGRFSFQGETEAVSGRFEWHWSPGGESLLLSDPVGRGVARVTRGRSGARILSADGEVREGEDIARLLGQLAGSVVPVQQLRYWLLGVPDPAVPARVIPHGDGLPGTIEQSGWTIRYSRYQRTSNAMLPVRLHAEGERMSLRLVINDWRLDDDS